MGGMEGLQPGLSGGGLLQNPLPRFFCLTPQQPPQQFPARVLRDNVDELNPTDQMLVRCLRVGDILTNGIKFCQNGISGF